jgi:hypothetical protein
VGLVDWGRARLALSGDEETATGNGDSVDDDGTVLLDGVRYCLAPLRGPGASSSVRAALTRLQRGPAARIASRRARNDRAPFIRDRVTVRAWPRQSSKRALESHPRGPHTPLGVWIRICAEASDLSDRNR